MITEDRLIQIMQKSIDGLAEANIVNQSMKVIPQMSLLGKDSQLDSVGFVSFISDIEERLSTETGKEIYLVLDDIQGFDMNNPHLSVNHFVKYLSNLVHQQ